jgi:hypothetical protein
MSVESIVITGGLVMKFNRVIFIALLIMAAVTAVSAQQPSVDQLKQMMEKSAGNLTTYTYSRSDSSDFLFSNASLKTEFDAYKSTQGQVDLVNKSGWWSSNLTDEESREVLNWEGYFLGSSEYWKQGRNWTKFPVNDTERMLQNYNEIPGQVELIKYSNVKLVGTEKLQGEDTYKLVGTPFEFICKGICGLQLLSAYIQSPLPLPEKLRNGTLDVNSTNLMNSSSTVLTAWVSKDKYLLKRLDINSSLIVTPEILNISSPDFKIVSTLNESTVYNNFGSPLDIVLPKEAQGPYSPPAVVDWRWAVFGSVRP